MARRSSCYKSWAWDLPEPLPSLLTHLWAEGEAFVMSWKAPHGLGTLSSPIHSPLLTQFQVHWPLCSSSAQMSVRRGLWHRPFLCLKGSFPRQSHNHLTSFTSLFKCHFLSETCPRLARQTLNLCGCVRRFLWHFRTCYIITYYSVYCSLSVSPSYNVRFLRGGLFPPPSIYLNKQTKYQKQFSQFSSSLLPTSGHCLSVLYELGYLWGQGF